MVKKSKLPAFGESVFDLAYLAFVLGAGLFFLSTAEDLALTLFGALALVLGGGDAFHLVPRIYGQISGQMEACTKILGFGKLVTSITMTVFYFLLYLVWAEVYEVPLAQPVTAVLAVLAILRVALCLFPQNRWFDKEQPLRWSLYRNIPFILIGILLIVLFASTAGAAGDPFHFMPLAIALSFLFYLPVVFLAQRFPAIGSLMLPKTIAYVWMISMGFHLST